MGTKVRARKRRVQRKAPKEVVYATTADYLDSFAQNPNREVPTAFIQYIARVEVEAGALGAYEVVNVLRCLLESPGRTETFLIIKGYDDDLELWEIEEVVDFLLFLFVANPVTVFALLGGSNEGIGGWEFWVSVAFGMIQGAGGFVPEMAGLVRGYLLDETFCPPDDFSGLWADMLPYIDPRIESTRRALNASRSVRRLVIWETGR